MANKSETLTIDRKPHWGTMEYPIGQGDIVRACLEYRNVTAVFGRSYGKTLTVRFLFWEECPTIDDAVYEFIYASPTQRLARFQYRDWKMWLKPILSNHLGLDKGSADQEMILHLKPIGKNKGAIVYFVGLQEYENLRGPRAHRIVIDECKDVDRRAVTAVLRPMLLGREGKSLYIGTPSVKGIGAAWFKAEYHKGQDVERIATRTHISFNAPSHANPYLSAAELQAIIEDCDDENEYREEVLAEFLEDQGAVFENLSRVFSIEEFEQLEAHYWVSEPPQPGIRYVMGLDIGRKISGDPSICSVFRLDTRRQVALLRMPGIPYAEQLLRIHQLRSRYNDATIYFDATGGHGLTMQDELALRYGDGAVPVTWSYQRKEADISAGRYLCQRAGREDDETFPGPGWYLMNIPWQKSEFADYMMVTESKSGEELKNPKYTAPAGQHDDSVCSALLCAGRLKHEWTPPAPRKPAPMMFTGAWLNKKIEDERKDKDLLRWTRP